MKLLLLSASLLLAAGGGQDSASLVDGMIERSNALKSFVAEYRVHARSPEEDSEGVEGVMRIAYRAPEDLAVEISGAGIGGRFVISSGTMSVVTPEGHGVAEQDSSLAQARSRIVRAFEEQFPGLGDVGGSQGLDVFVVFRAAPGTDSERPTFSCSAGTGRGEGPLLGWLGQLKRSKAVPASEGDTLLWDAGEGIRITLEKNTGFIEKIEVTYRGETKTGLELMSLSTNTEVEDAEFGMPAPDPSIEDMSESIAASLAVPKLMSMRNIIDRKIREGVEAESLEWNGDVRARLGKVLRVYHSELAPLFSERSVHRARSAIDSFCYWYQESKKALPEGDVARSDAFEEKAVDWDTRFRNSLEKWIDPYLAHGVPEKESAKAAAITAEFRALELEVAEAACRESVVEASLKYFDEQMERARNGELPPAKN